MWYQFSFKQQNNEYHVYNYTFPALITYSLIYHNMYQAPQG